MTYITYLEIIQIVINSDLTHATSSHIQASGGAYESKKFITNFSVTLKSSLREEL